MLNKYSATGERQYFERLISTVRQVQKIGPTSSIAACKSW